MSLPAIKVNYGQVGHSFTYRFSVPYQTEVHGPIGTAPHRTAEHGIGPARRSTIPAALCQSAHKRGSDSVSVQVEFRLCSGRLGVPGGDQVEHGRRLTSFSLVICPSVWPFDHGSVRAARPRSGRLRCLCRTRRADCSCMCASHGVTASASPTRHAMEAFHQVARRHQSRHTGFDRGRHDRVCFGQVVTPRRQKTVQQSPGWCSPGQRRPVFSLRRPRFWRPPGRDGRRR